MDLEQILGLVREHGGLAYAVVFAHAGANSLLMPLFAGYAAHTGALDWTTLVAVCWAGGFTGDVVRFWIGRRWGHAWVRSFPRIERGVATVTRLIERHHAWMLLVHRYPHGLRGIAGFAFGMSAVSWPRLLAIDFLSAGLWSVSVVSLGYGFGHVSEQALGEAASGAGLAALAVFLGLAWLLSRHIERSMESR